MELSIVLVTYNSEQYISGCLHSILGATEGIDREIIVVDNHSTDRTLTLVKEFLNSLELIENRENGGFAKAVNKGLKRSSGEFCLLINPDVLVKSDSLKSMIHFMKENPKAGICGCKLLNEDGSLQYSMGPFPGLLSTLWRMVLPRPMRKYYWRGYDDIRECDWVTGAFMLLRSKILEEVGLLDEHYFMYYEDVDLCLRGWEAGWRTFYYPGIAAVHLAPHASSDKGIEVERQTRKSRWRYFRKNILRLTNVPFD